VSDPRGTSLMMKPGYQTLSYQWGTGITNKRTGSSNWPKGKWQGSPRSMFQGKPHLLQKCMLPWLQVRKMSWDLSTPCLSGSGHYLRDLPPIMAHCSNTSKLLTIGEWSEKSSDSDSLNTIYRTSASESPITRLSSKGYHRLKPQQRGAWNLPTSTISRQTSVSSAALSLEEEQGLTNAITDSGAVWNPSR
jgi:hypothetical protein